MIPLGIGMGLFQSPNNSAIMGSVPRENSGVAGGLLSLTRVLGQITGIAVLGTIWAARVAAIGGTEVAAGDSRAPASVQVTALHQVLILSGAIVVGGLLLAGWGLWRERSGSRTGAEELAQVPRRQSVSVPERKKGLRAPTKSALVIAPLGVHRSPSPDAYGVGYSPPARDRGEGAGALPSVPPQGRRDPLRSSGSEELSSFQRCPGGRSIQNHPEAQLLGAAQRSLGGRHVLAGDPDRLEHGHVLADLGARPARRSPMVAFGSRPARRRSPASADAASTSSTTT